MLLIILLLVLLFLFEPPFNIDFISFRDVLTISMSLVIFEPSDQVMLFRCVSAEALPFEILVHEAFIDISGGSLDYADEAIGFPFFFWFCWDCWCFLFEGFFLDYVRILAKRLLKGSLTWISAVR